MRLKGLIFDTSTALVRPSPYSFEGTFLRRSISATAVEVTFKNLGFLKN